MTHDEVVQYLAACAAQPPCPQTTDPTQPCTCLPGTGRWVKHHPPTYGTMPEGWDEAMASFDPPPPEA